MKVKSWVTTLPKISCGHTRGLGFRSAMPSEVRRKKCRYRTQSFQPLSLTALIHEHDLALNSKEVPGGDCCTIPRVLGSCCNCNLGRPWEATPSQVSPSSCNHFYPIQKPTTTIQYSRIRAPAKWAMGHSGNLSTREGCHPIWKDKSCQNPEGKGKAVGIRCRIYVAVIVLSWDSVSVNWNHKTKI